MSNIVVICHLNNTTKLSFRRYELTKHTNIRTHNFTEQFQKFGFKIMFLYTSIYSVAHLQITVISEGYQWIGICHFSSVVDTDRYNRKETFTTEPVTTECRDVVVKWQVKE